MAEPEKITIIEGPPPTFEMAQDTWLLGLTEGPQPYQVALCRVRTFNGPALVERCYRAWRDKHPISLEYRDEEGLTQQAPILAVRWVELPEGDVLLIWVRHANQDIEFQLEFDFDDFEDIDDLEDFDPFDDEGDDPGGGNPDFII